MITRIRHAASNLLPRVTHYRSPQGDAWVSGVGSDANTIAATFCGLDSTVQSTSRIWRNGLLTSLCNAAEAGACTLVRCPDDGDVDPIRAGQAVEIPLLIQHRAHLPATIDGLHAWIRAECDKEDLRRIRRAQFTCHIETDAARVREFYEHYYRPYILRRHASEASLDTFERFEEILAQGGELLCLEMDGEWIAGMLNVRLDGAYAVRYMGTRDGDAAINTLRAIPAMFIRSMERAIDLEYDIATLGTTLPFLGEGNARFKAKWGSTLSRIPYAPATAHMFLDLRHEFVRAFLSREPVVRCVGDDLHGVRWLDPDADSLKRACRDATRFRGVDHWHVIGTADTIDAGQSQLDACSEVTAVAVPDQSPHPLWLGELVRG